MSVPTAREQQLAEISRKVAEWREDAAKCRDLAEDSRRRAEEHAADAARAHEMADRWEAVGRAIYSGTVPGLDVTYNTEEVPF